MGKILTAFADENLVVDPIYYKGNAEYQRALTTVFNLSEELDKQLKKKEKKKLEQFRDAIETLNQMFALDRFIDGYRLGVLMTTEVFTESDHFFHAEEVE